MATLTAEQISQLILEQTQGTFTLLKQVDGKIDTKFDHLEKKMDEKVESLAVSTAKEFNQIGLEFMRVRHYLETLTDKIEGLEARTSTRFALVEQELVEVNIRLATISKQSLEDTYVEGKDIQKLQSRLSKLETRFEKISSINNPPAKM